MILRGAGFETVDAANGVEALERLRERGAQDLALVDWNMPQMDGHSFLCAVRSDHAYDEMKVVMVTTETELAQVQNALEHGANEYIMKPFTKDAVLEKLQLLGMVAATV